MSWWGVSFVDRDDEALYLRKRVKRLDTRLHLKTLTKLMLRDAARELDELRGPLEEQFEAANGARVS